MDRTAAHMGGSGQLGGLRKPPHPALASGMANYVSPWNGVSDEPTARSSSGGWAEFGPSTNGTVEGEWTAEFSGGRGVNRSREEKDECFGTVTTIECDKRPTKVALNDSITDKSWKHCTCTCDVTANDRVCVAEHANACMCTCHAKATDCEEHVSQTNWSRKSVSHEVADESGWQSFTSCDVGQETTSPSEAKTAWSVFTSSVILGGHLDPRQTLSGQDPKPRSLSAPLAQRPRANAMAAAAPCLCESSHTVFRQVFAVPPHEPTITTSHSDSTSGGTSSLPSVLDQRAGLWSCLVGSRSPAQLTTSCSSIQDRLYGALFTGGVCSLEGPATPVELSLDLTSGFDWTQESVSPDFLPSIFRPKRESLVDIEFDHSRAAEGLASLSVEELQTMCDEMTRKFQRLSDELISELQQRDVVVNEMDSKNQFISTILKVQSLRHSVRSGANGSGIDMVLRSRPRSRAKAREERQTGKYLHTIVPYTPPEDMQWSVSTLRQLTKILQAIAEDSDSVPSLVSDYLQSEVLVSPVKQRPPVSLDDSLREHSV